MDIGPIGKFQVLGTLGSGAHSSILHIRRSRDSKHYALKVVPIGGKEDLKFLEQAQHEVRIAAMLDHPNLIKVYTLETPRDWLYRLRKVHLLIEYVNGKTLDIVPRLSIPRLVQIFVQVAAGMVHMHRKGVFHADLKPNNILLSRAGEVKIIDFGLAWIRGQAKGRVQGTPEYMAPEQAHHGMVNERTDIYNLGATMYRMFTGRFVQQGIPKPGDDRKLVPPLKVNSRIPGPLNQLIIACVELDPSRRPAGMFEIRDQLSATAKQMGLADVDLRGADEDE
jgi:eukaryotic-like serine/threonine-protein kinase